MGDIPDHMQVIAVSLFRPVLSFLMARGLHLRQILEIVKITLISLAQEELELVNAPVNASKISLMTGVHRKDIAELLERPTLRPTNESPLIKVIGAWRTSPKYKTKAGRSRPLDVTGKDSEFAALVRSVHSELNPYSVLFELQRVHAVEERKGMVHLLAHEYVPKNSDVEHYLGVGRDISMLVRACEENIEKSPKVPNLQLTTSFDNIPESSVSGLKKWCLSQGAALHDEARKVIGSHDRDINPAKFPEEKRFRVAIGTFSYAEEIK